MEPRCEHWTDEDREFYKRNRTTIDRNLQFRLVKELMKINPKGYKTAGDYLSDELLRTIRDSQVSYIRDITSPTLAHYQRRKKAREGKER